MPKCSKFPTNLLKNSLQLKPFSQTQTLLSFSSSNHPHPPPVSPQIFKSTTTSHKWGSYKLGDLSFYSLIENFASSFDFDSLEHLLNRMKRENRVFIEKNFIVIFKAYGKAHLP
ncbi:hypothetical protein P8452_16813 [Trifolium repens]|nr:hypothetical protein P8452_16813 [Trifolium repens]